MTHAQVAARTAEQELLGRVQDGDEEAFEALVLGHQAAMLRVARAYVRGGTTAEEVVEHAWLAILTELERFDPRTTLRAWVLRHPAHSAEAPRAFVPGPSSSPTVLQRLRASIGVLAPEERAVLILRDGEGWTADEVCHAMDIGDDVQRALLHAARSRLRTMLEPAATSG
jgi:RNA polymerase sigma-70 factor, ECF subfamily